MKEASLWPKHACRGIPVICDRCGNEVKQTFRGGSLDLCHRCAHEMGLLHIHRDKNGDPDPEIEGSTHYLDGFFSKEEIEAHIEAFKERTR